LKSFQCLSLECHAKIEDEQQQLIFKIQVIQHYFQEARKSLNKIILLEKEAKARRNTFQKVVTCSGNREMLQDLKLFVTKKIRGDIMFKSRETNIVENKKIFK
jgi:hypothetical protein